MNRILEKCKDVIIHIDDVLLIGNTEAEHDENVKDVLDKVTLAGITLNKSKCTFKQK